MFDNYDKQISPVPTTSLPIVRTDAKRYLRAVSRDLRVNSLALSHSFPLTENLFGVVYGGLMEYQFAGIGGELMYQRLGQPWALSVDVNQAKKRSPTRVFELEDYETVTGHARLHYAPANAVGAAA